MKVNIEDRDDIRVFKISGRLVGSASLEFKRKIDGNIVKLPDDKLKVVLNLNKLTIVDSSGLGVIESLRKSIDNRGGRFALAELSKGLQTLLAITKMTKVFDIYDTEDEAVETLTL